MQLRSLKVDFYYKWPYRTYNMMDMNVLKRRETYMDVLDQSYMESKK